MNTNIQKLSGKVAIVTGASKGIGAAIATHLAAAGASVVVNYSTSKDGADRVVGLIEKSGGRALAVQANVTKQDDIDRLFAATETAFGRLDILVNNAGVFEFAPLEKVTAEHFHRQFDLNVLGLLLASQRALASFGEEGGSIINIGSAISSAPQPNGSVYSATKAAVDAITVSLSKELGARRIRVNSINPGMVETEGATAAGFIGSDFQDVIVAQTPLGRIGQPSDVGPVAVFLASDDSRWMTGETLLVAGGYR